MDKQVALADFLDDPSLIRLAGYTGFERGRAYFFGNCVTLRYVSSERVEAVVRGELDYRVLLRVKDGQLQYTCSCPVGEGGYFCKHLVAAAIQARGQVPLPPQIAWRRKLDGLLRQISWFSQSEEATPVAARQYVVVFGLTQRAPGHWDLLPFRIYVGGISEEVRAIDWNNPEEIERFLNRQPQRKAEPIRSLGDTRYCLNADSGAYLLASVLCAADAQLNNRLEWFWRTPLPLYLCNASGELHQRLELHPNVERVVMVLSKSEKTYELQLALTLGEEIQPLPGKKVFLVQTHPPVLLLGKTLVRISHPPGSVLEKLLEEPQIQIPAAYQKQFMEEYFPKIAEALLLIGEGIQHSEEVQPRPRLYLFERNKELVAELRFDYLGKEVPYHSPQGYLVVAQGQAEEPYIVRRNRAYEEAVERTLVGVRYGLKRLSPKQFGHYTLRAKVHILDFLLRSVPLLVKEGFEIFGEERIRSVRVNRARPTLSVRVSSGIDWFDLSIAVQFGDQKADWKEVRAAILKGQPYVKLADGSIGQIPEEWIARLKKAFALTKAGEQGLELAKTQLPLVDLLLEEAEQREGLEELDRLRERLWNFERIEPQPLPRGFRGELRPYQKAGYDWLHFLYRYRLGGCLADDMGLGKTVQVLAFLQSLKERREPVAAHLLVVPKSLVANWQREAERFTPELRFLEYSGAARPRDLEAFDGVDVVLTTYGVVLRDVEKLRRYDFDLVILDESQAVKNPLAQISKAVRLLNGRRRLVMTGTPVENNAFELWSQFAFLQPGLLGSLETFRREFANPIEGEGDTKTAELLRRLVYPFILRRTKAQVAPELPPRQERMVYTQMVEEQEELYRKTRDYYRNLLLGSPEALESFEQRMKVLEGLLRLRQISIHPALVDPGYRGEAPKFTWLLETLETLQQEGHKALIFSQFVEALQLLRRELDLRSWRYAYLDGQTYQRQSQVDAFQKDPDLPFFLISLKAGGVGLNLTAADYVIHLDPWWNPAVERQAADRTHRIGQEKPVFIYRIIVRHTVEEKILLLQEKKRQLVDQLIRAEGTIFKSLTPEDLEVLFS
ncbi:MAG: SNF2-related protein [Anaerolineales bacterium]|nr:DEAD/DEAH box helicase [Anaerolineales bacterium]MDW8445825.1 SNF2-related protein [Anaerolineales bacterium]